MSFGNPNIDKAPAVDEQRFHALGPRRLAGTDNVPIRRRLQNVRRFEVVDSQIFWAAFDGLKTPRGDESRDRHTLPEVLFLIPAVKFDFESGIDIGHEKKQSVRHELSPPYIRSRSHAIDAAQQGQQWRFKNGRAKGKVGR